MDKYAMKRNASSTSGEINEKNTREYNNDLF